MEQMTREESRRRQVRKLNPRYFLQMVERVRGCGSFVSREQIVIERLSGVRAVWNKLGLRIIRGSR